MDREDVNRLIAIGITLFLLFLLYLMFTVLLPTIVALTMNIVYLFPLLFIIIGGIYGVYRMVLSLLE
ncbi:MAG: hypothetical protein AAGG75_11025 [Bacteroidota bacterium]